MDFTTISVVGWIGVLIAIAGGITTIWKGLQSMREAAAAAREPEEVQNRRLDEIERRLDKYDRYLDSDKAQLEELRRANNIQMRVLLALLSHAIDGNNEAEMREARTDLIGYMTGASAGTSRGGQ